MSDYNPINSLINNLEIEHVYFCAGARNSSLLNNFKGIQIHLCLDERSASFSALGHAKLSNKPVIICTTSGTAVAECFSAMIEAYYSNIKLIMISADRPKRLHGTHAAQTINQIGIFNHYARSQFSCDINSFEKEEIHLLDRIKNKSEQSYPVHINIELDHLANNYLTSELHEKKVNPVLLSQGDLLDTIQTAKYPLALFTESSENHEMAFDELNRLYFPIHLEVTAGLENKTVNNPILFEKDLLSLYENHKLDLILKFGKTPISKLWRVLDCEQGKTKIVSIGTEAIGLPYGEKYSGGFDWKQLDSYLPDLSLSEMNEKRKHVLFNLLEKYSLSEAAVFHKIKNEIPSNDIVYIGNSMPIRYWQMMCLTRRETYAARGANGIDGQISQAMGMANGTDKNIHCVIGDLTFLYDFSVLAFEIPNNLTIHVINNSGGRIFERVDVSAKMIIEHEVEIKKLIQGFKSKHKVFEYFPDLNQTRFFWKEWDHGQ